MANTAVLKDTSAAWTAAPASKKVQPFPYELLSLQPFLASESFSMLEQRASQRFCAKMACQSVQRKQPAAKPLKGSGHAVPCQR